RDCRRRPNGSAVERLGPQDVVPRALHRALACPGRRQARFDRWSRCAKHRYACLHQPAPISLLFMKVADKVVVVTGAGSGMGRELALELLDRKARVAAVDLNAQSLEQTAALA